MYSLIVVDYCSIKKTVEYIQHFISCITDKSLVHPIIVDNMQTREGLDYLNLLFGKGKQLKVDVQAEVYFFHCNEYSIIYCWTGKNMGYAKGNNLGTEISDILFDDLYYIISNNDIKLESLFDWKMFQDIFDSDSKIAVIGPRILGLDGSDQSPHKRVGAFNYLIINYWLKNWPFHWKVDYDYTGESKKCYRVMGCFLIIKADSFRKAGRFDPNTFMYAEEMILSERLLKLKFCCYFYNEFRVLHEHGATVKKIASSLQNDTWTFESCRYYFKKYRNTSNLILYMSDVNFMIYKALKKVRYAIRNLGKGMQD